MARGQKPVGAARRAAHPELWAANEELCQVNEESQALTRSPPLAIWVLDLDGEGKRSAQPAAAGDSRPSARGIPAMAGAILRWRVDRRRTAAAAEKGRITERGERLDGALQDAKDRCGTIARDADISARKLLEEQFWRSQKLQGVGRLAGGVAHDFNNLLTLIMGYVEILAEEVSGRPQLADCTQEIQYAANRPGALTAQNVGFWATPDQPPGGAGSERQGQ
jgi:signal transduction histidine kinase